MTDLYDLVYPIVIDSEQNTLSYTQNIGHHKQGCREAKGFKSPEMLRRQSKVNPHQKNHPIFCK